MYNQLLTNAEHRFSHQSGLDESSKHKIYRHFECRCVSRPFDVSKKALNITETYMFVENGHVWKRQCCFL